MLNEAVKAFETWLFQSDAAHWKDVGQYRDFYEGRHDITLTKRQEARLGLTTSQIHALANVCQMVVDTVAERMSISGFDAADDQTAAMLAEWWHNRDLDAYQDDIHLGALRDGDGYLLVGWDTEDGQPRFYYEPADDGTNGAGMVYASEYREPLYGYKRWRVEEGDEMGSQRLNLYFNDRVEKYITGRRGGWIEYSDPGDPAWPVPLVDRLGRPLGIPLFHFPSNPNGNDYGTSELEVIIPLQRVLTSLWVDLIAAADATGFQIITLTGDTPSAEMLNAARAIWYTPNPGAAWGTIPPGDLSVIVEAIRHTTMTIAQVSRVPLTMFQDTRAVSSSETIVASERGLVAKVNDRAKSFGLAWRAAMRYAVRLHNEFTGSALPLDNIRPRWASFEQVDALALESSRAAVAGAHIANGLSVEAAYQLAGYNEAKLAVAMRTDTFGDEGLTQ